jgi:hypothetical protein
MTEYATYTQGVNDAKRDLAEGWVDEDTTFTEIEEQLKMSVGASKQYIQGYLTVVGI